MFALGVAEQVVSDTMRATKLHAQADEIESAINKEHADIVSSVILFAKVS